MSTKQAYSDNLDKQYKLAELLRVNGIDLTCWQVFLSVAKNEGDAAQDIYPFLVVSRSAFGRYISTLSGAYPLKKLDEESKLFVGGPYIEARAHPHDFKRKALYLTEAGRKLLAKSASLIK